MKKLVLIMLALIAVPVFADPTISLTNDGATVTVSYDAIADGNLVSGFGLEVSLSGGATIVASSFQDLSTDYTIHPTNLEILNGEIDVYGSPIAVGGETTSSMILEFGALYVGEANEPEPNGVLCSFDVSGDCTVTVAGDVDRGGMVMEGAVASYGDQGETFDTRVIATGPADCFPAGHPDYDEWVNVGKPASWCFVRQCHGDADGQEEGVLIKKWVSSNDLSIFVAQWQTNSLDADFDHAEEGVLIKKRVSSNDLSIFIANWQTNPTPDCLDF